MPCGSGDTKAYATRIRPLAMASQANFPYDANCLAALELAISTERLRPYLTMANGHRKTAILLYERNAYLSEALYGVTQAAEIALRNSIHRALSDAHSSMWFDSAGLSDPQADMVLKARYTISNMRRSVTPGGVVAELNLGFWTALISAKYEKSLWVPHLHKIFPNATKSKIDKDGKTSMSKLNRAEIHARLEKVRFLRNRIAHHESILRLDLEQLYCETLEALSWICKTSSDWVRSTNCFSQRFKRQVPIPPPITIPTPAPILPGIPRRPAPKS